jgi:hypothetical protein
MHTRLSCKIDYLLRSNHRDRSIASEFFTDDTQGFLRPSPGCVRSSDTLLTFALREVERVISDQSRTNRETINQLWGILDDPHLNNALGFPKGMH